MELNHRPTGYESVALPLSYTGTRINLSSLILFLSNSNMPDSNLDPNLRARLLKETKNPYRGLRRAVWIALFWFSSPWLIYYGYESVALPLSYTGIRIKLSSFDLFFD